MTSVWLDYNMSMLFAAWVLVVFAIIGVGLMALILSIVIDIKDCMFGILDIEKKETKLNILSKLKNKTVDSNLMDDPYREAWEGEPDPNKRISTI